MSAAVRGRSPLFSALASLCLCALLVSEALAAAKPTIVPPQPGDQVAYDFTSTTYTPGRQDHEDGSFALLREKNSVVEIDFLPLGAVSETYRAVILRDGTLELDASTSGESEHLPFVLQRFNQVSAVVSSAPPSFKSGDTWKTKVNVPLPRGASVDVPVVVKVTAADDAAFDLDVNGATRTQLNLSADAPQANSLNAGTGAGGTVPEEAGPPLDLSLHIAAHVVGGKLDRANGTLHSTVPARDDIDITSNWSMSTHKPAAN